MTKRRLSLSLIVIIVSLLANLPQVAAQRAGGMQPSSSPLPNPATGLEGMPIVGTRSFIIYGKVTFADGSAPGQLVMIERVCKGLTQSGGFADSKGRFSFDLGVLNKSITGGGIGDAMSTGQLAANTVTADDLMKCEMRASLSGYRSQNLPLSHIANGQKTELGTIVLNQIGKDRPPAVSEADAQAPKNAKKAFEKALDAAAKAKWQEAVESFTKATSTYPKYASAWFSLGKLQSGNQQTAAALQSFKQSLAADDKFALPYVELAVLESMASQWEPVLEHTQQAIRLSPGSFPRAYLLNAWANSTLQHFDVAEKSATEGIRLDEEHRYPELEYVQGIALLGQRDKEGAIKHLEAYLALAPKGAYASAAQQQLATIRAAH